MLNHFPRQLKVAGRCRAQEGINYFIQNRKSKLIVQGVLKYLPTQNPSSKPRFQAFNSQLQKEQRFAVIKPY
jgi:hypothetical protein